MVALEPVESFKLKPRRNYKVFREISFTRGICFCNPPGDGIPTSILLNKTIDEYLLYIWKLMYWALVK